MQTDHFYDKPDHSLRRAGCGLRIRKLKVLRSPAGQQVDVRPTVTFKGPVDARTDLKIRRELETKLDCSDVLDGIFLEAAGFEKVCTIQKRRASYKLGRSQVELDTLPLLGCFVEIEGSEAGIEKIRRKLGITADHINASYVQMLTQRCREIKRSASEITFERFPD